MICKNSKCAKEIPDGSLYCSWCGRKQAEARSKKKRGNGQGAIFRLPDGRYCAQVVLGYYSVTDESGKTRMLKRTASKICSKAKDAAAALPELRLKGLQPKRPAELTISELHDTFLKSKKYEGMSSGHQDKLGYAWARWKPVWHRHIADVTIDELQDVMDALDLTYYPSKDMKVCMSHIYTLAIQREILAYNKTEYLELPDAPHAKKQIFTDAELKLLWDDYEGRDKTGALDRAAAHPFTGYILMMIYIGLRPGEMRGIRKDDVHLPERYMMGGIKTEAGRERKLAICDKILPVVKLKFLKGKAKMLEMGEKAFYDQYWEALARAGVRHLPPMTCRHTYATRMTAAGVKPGIVAAAMGHKDFNTTLKNYIDIPLADILSAVNTI